MIFDSLQLLKKSIVKKPLLKNPLRIFKQQNCFAVEEKERKKSERTSSYRMSLIPETFQFIY